VKEAGGEEWERLKMRALAGEKDRVDKHSNKSARAQTQTLHRIVKDISTKVSSDSSECKEMQNLTFGPALVCPELRS
jgi:hypothetical protein